MGGKRSGVQTESLEDRRQRSRESGEDRIYPSKPQATLLLMGLNNPLRNFIGEQEKAFKRLWALSFGKKAGAGPANDFLESWSRI